MTNYEKIRAMSVEELAAVLADSEAEEEAEQNGLTDGQKDALLRTFLGRGGGSA